VKILLDTCAFLWIITGSPRLSLAARRAFEDPSNTIFLSAISTWEILVKNGLGKLSLPHPPADYLKIQRERHGISALPLEESAALHEPRLPRFHSDPFDRMLLCQAIELGCAILTPDEEISKYPVRIIW
jgi:PIN domain nuclease of toxin-antitoxin system